MEQIVWSSKGIAYFAVSFFGCSNIISASCESISAMYEENIELEISLDYTDDVNDRIHLS